MRRTVERVIAPRRRLALRRVLVEWFRANRRALPWRELGDPYAVWVSEVMLQQTQVATAVPYFEAFLAEFPSLDVLAAAPLEHVLRCWSGLGYYRRARHLHSAAQQVMTLHGGRLPCDFEALRALPGVGDYTAGAILSIAFDLPVPAVDGNVERVLCRLQGFGGDPRRQPTRGMVRKAAQELVLGPEPGDLNQALMELGATVCRARSPECQLCPVTDLCIAYQSGRQSEIPPRRLGRIRERRRAVAAVIRRARQVLLAQRPQDEVWGGLWEFPQAEVADEQPDQVLTRHVQLSLGLSVEPREPLLRISYGIMNHVVDMEVLACRLIKGRLRAQGYTAADWFSLDAALKQPLSSPHRKIARFVTEA